ncbi:MAG: sigma-70 family RNA polymerase sigma factor [Lachnospiraceae bacterium]|nr:sigma-70 family RNA polymerase sigma factor [Lachnospiraceae bacterium]
MLDEEIIELFFERSEKAIEELEAKYGKICLQTSYNILGNYSDAEECVNDSYLGAWNAIPPARPAPLLTYVLKIVRNLSLNCYHRNQARKRNSTYDLAVEELSEFLAAPESVESAMETKELVQSVEEFLDSLKTRDRVIFIRRYWFYDSYEQIAERVGISAKNVSVKLTRLRRQLKVYLEERGNFL